MHRTAYTLLLLATLFWGGNAVAGKLAVGHVSPMLLTTSRWGLALVVLCIIGWPRFAADWPKVRRHAAYLALLGAVGFTGFNVALYSAVIHTSAINVSIEQAGIPMFIFLINFLLYKLRATAAQIAGFVVSIAGVVLVASHGDPVRLSYHKWLNRHPRVSTVILGASRIEQLRDNLGALAVTPELTPEVVARIDDITKPLAQ